MPALRAQACPSGPLGSQKASAIGATMSVASAAVRAPVGSGLAAITRIQVAIRTAATQVAVRASSQPALASVPVASPCTTATGQET